MKQFFFLICFFAAGMMAVSQTLPCATIVRPAIKESTMSELKNNLAIAKSEYEKDTTKADALIWYGRRTAYTGDYMKAIEIFSSGITMHPYDARMYRHRGHRYLTVRCFDKAIADFEKAGGLIKGQPDEIEPDGMPNAKNIPTSTLHANIWYHLGLAYFIKRDFKNAVKAYKKGLKVSTHPDMYVATLNWMNLALREMKKYKEAIALYNSIDTTAELIESKDYKTILDMYGSKRTEKKVEDYAIAVMGTDRSLSSATLNFGIGYYCHLLGLTKTAIYYFNKAIDTKQWSSFGYIAAEAMLAGIK